MFTSVCHMTIFFKQRKFLFFLLFVIRFFSLEKYSRHLSMSKRFNEVCQVTMHRLINEQLLQIIDIVVTKFDTSLLYWTLVHQLKCKRCVPKKILLLYRPVSKKIPMSIRCRYQQLGLGYFM